MITNMQELRNFCENEGQGQNGTYRVENTASKAAKISCAMHAIFHTDINIDYVYTNGRKVGDELSGYYGDRIVRAIFKRKYIYISL